MVHALDFYYCYNMRRSRVYTYVGLGIFLQVICATNSNESEIEMKISHTIAYTCICLSAYISMSNFEKLENRRSDADVKYRE